jgi:GNAT superfamily N-acetyltransferase
MSTTIYYLELLNPNDFRPSGKAVAEVSIRQEITANPQLSRYLYETVGKDWQWSDRLKWIDQQWNDYLTQPDIEVWVAYVAKEIAGYFELEQEARSNVKIAYFGLLPQFINQCLGGYLLTAAIQQAWTLGATRVWTHTCSLEHPHALANYVFPYAILLKTLE